MFYDDKNFDHRVVSLILTKDQLGAIGSVVVESTACEELVESLIWNLSRLSEEQGKFFTSNIPMKPRLDLLGTLGKPLLRSEKKRVEFSDLISKLKEANEARNIVVHGTWQTNGVGVLQVMQDGAEKHPPAIAKKRRPKSPPATKSAAEIESIALDLSRLTFELIHFSRSWRRVPSPKRQLQQLIRPKQSPARIPPGRPANPPQRRASQG